MKKMHILQLITHPHVVLDTQDLHSYSEDKLRYFDEIQELSDPA